MVTKDSVARPTKDVLSALEPIDSFNAITTSSFALIASETSLRVSNVSGAPFMISEILSSVYSFAVTNYDSILFSNSTIKSSRLSTSDPVNLL